MTLFWLFLKFCWKNENLLSWQCHLCTCPSTPVAPGTLNNTYNVYTHINQSNWKMSIRHEWLDLPCELASIGFTRSQHATNSCEMLIWFVFCLPPRVDILPFFGSGCVNMPTRVKALKLETCHDKSYDLNQHMSLLFLKEHICHLDPLIVSTWLNLPRNPTENQNV